MILAEPCDRDSLRRADINGAVEWRLHEFRLTRETVPLAQEIRAVCVFVNDHLDRS